MKKIFIILLFSCTQLLAQEPDKEGSFVKWMTLKEAMLLQKAQPKPMIIDFYTDWCGWCKHMMKTTYANQGLAQYINTYFYPVKFDAEGKDTVEYLGEKYFPSSKEPRTPHPFAVKLLNSKLMYPTTLFLSGYDKEKDEFKVSMVASGFLEQQKIEPILILILENAGRNSSYDDFRDHFQQAFYDSTNLSRQKEISWLSPKQLFESSLPKSKKTLVMINISWCTSCKVMTTTSFIDSTVESYLKDKFNLVNFDAEISDSILFKGQMFTNPKNAQMPFHQLAVSLGRNSISFPSLIILDENLEFLDVIPSYLPPLLLNSLARYYGDNINKVKSWQDYFQGSKSN